MNNKNYTSTFDLHYGASLNIQEKAKYLRQNMTDAEKILWQKLKNKQISNCKFRRQHPVDVTIVDFYCHEAKLIIEVDGEIHNTKENIINDSNRTSHLNNLGLVVIRFTNLDVENNIDYVIDRIDKICRKLINDLT